MKYVNQKEFVLHLVINLIMIFASTTLFSQNRVSYDSIKDNSIGISPSNFKLWSDKNQGVFFFCPIGEDYKDSAYIKQSKIYEKDSRIAEFSGKIKFIFYKENNNNSKNPFLLNTFKTNDSIINQLQCFIYLKSDKNLKRAEKIIGEKFKYKADKNNLNLYRIDITDLVCPKDLPSKTAFYLEILNEILVPKYTLEEKIDQLEHKVKNLETEINILKKSKECPEIINSIEKSSENN